MVGPEDRETAFFRAANRINVILHRCVQLPFSRPPPPMGIDDMQHWFGDLSASLRLLLLSTGASVPSSDKHASIGEGSLWDRLYSVLLHLGRSLRGNEAAQPHLPQWRKQLAMFLVSHTSDQHVFPYEPRTSEKSAFAALALMQALEKPEVTWAMARNMLLAPNTRCTKALSSYTVTRILGDMRVSDAVAMWSGYGIFADQQLRSLEVCALERMHGILPQELPEASWFMHRNPGLDRHVMAAMLRTQRQMPADLEEDPDSLEGRKRLNGLKALAIAAAQDLERSARYEQTAGAGDVSPATGGLALAAFKRRDLLRCEHRQAPVLCEPAAQQAPQAPPLRAGLVLQRRSVAERRQLGHQNWRRASMNLLVGESHRLRKVAVILLDLLCSDSQALQGPWLQDNPEVLLSIRGVKSVQPASIGAAKTIPNVLSLFMRTAASAPTMAVLPYSYCTDANKRLGCQDITPSEATAALLRSDIQHSARRVAAQAGLLLQALHHEQGRFGDLLRLAEVSPWSALRAPSMLAETLVQHWDAVATWSLPRFLALQSLQEAYTAPIEAHLFCAWDALRQPDSQHCQWPRVTPTTTMLQPYEDALTVQRIAVWCDDLHWSTFRVYAAALSASIGGSIEQALLAMESPIGSWNSTRAERVATDGIASLNDAAFGCLAWVYREGLVRMMETLRAATGRAADQAAMLLMQIQQAATKFNELMWLTLSRANDVRRVDVHIYLLSIVAVQATMKNPEASVSKVYVPFTLPPAITDSFPAMWNAGMDAALAPATSPLRFYDESYAVQALLEFQVIMRVHTGLLLQLVTSSETALKEALRQLLIAEIRPAAFRGFNQLNTKSREARIRTQLMWLCSKVPETMLLRVMPGLKQARSAIDAIPFATRAVQYARTQRNAIIAHLEGRAPSSSSASATKASENKALKKAKKASPQRSNKRGGPGQAPQRPSTPQWLKDRQQRLQGQPQARQMSLSPQLPQLSQLSQLSQLPQPPQRPHMPQRPQMQRVEVLAGRPGILKRPSACQTHQALPQGSRVRWAPPDELESTSQDAQQAKKRQRVVPKPPGAPNAVAEESAAQDAPMTV
jgi:hypothetical protein